MQVKFATAFAMGLLIAAPAIAAGPALNATQQHGQQILMTSCGLCHTPPDINNPHMAPELSKETLGGSVPDIVAFIKAGTEKMPSLFCA